MLDVVIAVAGCATRQASRFESGLVWAFFEQLRLKNMASGADILHASYARRRRPVIPMTGRASGCAQVATLRHCLVVYALAVFGELRGLDAVRFHVFGIGVTLAACGRNVQRVDGGANVAGRANVMNTVT